MRVITTVIIGLAFAAASLNAAQAAGQSRKGKGASPATHLKDPSQKPKPGIIYVKGKRFTSCTDWGKDKGWCSKNM
jgi:hypothetical protein